jgi:mRNA interferase MazF
MYSQQNIIVYRGEIFEADLGEGIGSEQRGNRPVVVIQNNKGNKCSTTIIVAAITSQINKAKLPTHVEISKNGTGLDLDSVILLEQIRTIDKKRLKRKIGICSEETLEKINKATLVSIGIDTEINQKDTYVTTENKQIRNYTIPQLTQKEVFDFTKAKRMARTINEIEKQMIKLKNTDADLYEMKNDKKEYLIELQSYCKKFNKDWNMFYTPISNNMMMYRGVEGNARAI